MIIISTNIPIYAVCMLCSESISACLPELQVGTLVISLLNILINSVPHFQNSIGQLIAKIGTSTGALQLSVCSING